MKKVTISVFVLIVVFILSSCVLFQDTIPPSVNLTLSYTVAKPNVKVSATVEFSDNDVVDRIELYSGSSLIQVRTVGKKSGTEVFELPEIPIEEGIIKDVSVVAKVYDKVGNVKLSNQATLTLDFRKPVITIKNEYVGYFVDVEVQKGPKLIKIEIYCNNGKIEEIETQISEGVVRIPVSIPDNSTEILVKAESEFGIFGQATKTIIVDKVAPQVSIPTVISAPYVSGTITIDITASDDNLDKVEYYLNSSKIGEKKSGPFSISIDTAKYPDGAYTFKAKAYDKAGNSSEASISFMIDNNPPSVSIKSLTSEAYISGTKNIEVSAEDGNGIKKVELYLNNNKVGEATSSPYIFNLNTSGYSNGQYTLKAVAYDIFDKRSETSIQIYIDNTPPTVSIVSPSSGEVVVGIVEVRVNASDNYGLSKLELYLDYSKVGEKTTEPYLLTIDTRSYISGTSTLKAIAYDLAGNKKEASINITIQKPLPGDIIWKFKTGGSIASCPAIDTSWSRKAIYFGSDDGYLYALSFDGQMKWRYKTNDWVHISPVVDTDGTIYVGSDDGYLYAVKPDGTLKWKTPVGDWVRSSPALYYSTLYVANRGGEIYAIRTYDGTKKWRVQIGSSIYSSPAVGKDGTIYIGSGNGKLYAIDDWDGETLWEFKTNGSIQSSPAIDNYGTVYIGSDDGCVYAVRPNGTLKWQVQTGHGVRSSPVIGSDGTVYVGSDDGYLYAINSDGIIKWTFKTNGYIRTAPVVGSDGTIYVASNDGYVYAVSSSGKEKWRRSIGYVPSSATLDDDGTLYIGANDGYLYWIQTNSTSGLARSDWPKFKRDLRNTGYVWSY
ncbi:PQQ-binding-like beta-propeller repeat protein [Fervidobacterium islandicum]|uniref:PQQ-binding-like beta-propeller repeat protein n=1 Tax=Fervidobacterium islandicum TaxID=2423 RepID=A0AAJ5L9X8_FERIS|nr:PQQ-binding-like beta-propeller repeat protein [Fervidobacterium islandicum]UOE96809.1 PQQ-binding-like beta-propeller repeat protein [Fervidobacterium islandicum]